jgi:multiple sugar transport system permease protein
MFRHGRAEARLALHVLLPAILLVLVFRIFPLFWGFAISLTSATSTDPGEFVGAANDLRALDDPNFRASIANAGVVALHPHLRNAADAAGDPDRPGRSGRTLFRSVYFFPVVLFSVIIGSIFSVVLASTAASTLRSRCWDLRRWTGSVTPPLPWR